MSYLKSVHVETIIGFRNRDLIILEEEFKHYSTNLSIMMMMELLVKRDWCSQIRRIDYEGHQFDEVIAIGPLIMMKFVALLTKNIRLKPLST